jgi:choline dehydrogenase-like flavoprotein
MQVLLDTHTLADCIEAEVPPHEKSPLSSQSPSEDFQVHIRASGMAHNHSAGTAAAMGTMVYPDPRVYRVQNPRVLDASVLPVGINGYL